MITMNDFEQQLGDKVVGDELIMDDIINEIQTEK